VNPPRFLKPVEEQVRPAQQQDVGKRRVPLGEGGQVLVDHRLEQAGDDLLDGDAGVHQGVGVALGEDAALGGDRVDGVSCESHPRQIVRHSQLAGGLLHERAGTAGACALHEHLLATAVHRVPEEQRLHILAADLADEVHRRVEALHRRCHRHHLLHRPGADVVGHRACAGTGGQHTVPSGGEAVLFLQPGQEFQHLVRLLRAVPLVLLRHRGAVLRAQDVLARGAAHVEAEDHAPLRAA
jgi:hypothetical protein